MKKLNVILLGLTLLLFSFKDKKPAPSFIPGTYGICNCDDANKTSAKFMVTLNPDLTYHYVYTFEPKKTVDISGSYTCDGDVITLAGTEKAGKIHDKWKMDKTNKCIKSRLGLEFSRLCLVSPCK